MDIKELSEIEKLRVELDFVLKRASFKKKLLMKKIKEIHSCKTCANSDEDGLPIGGSKCDYCDRITDYADYWEKR